MTAPRRNFHFDQNTSSESCSVPPAFAQQSLAAGPRAERVRLAQRDNPDAPPARQRRPLERQPRTYTQPEFAPRRKRSPADEPPTPHDPTPEQLDRWDEEWRDEWDRGDVDDSAAYEDDTLDVADQTRDVEWLLDALDALDDEGSVDDAFEWKD